MATRTPRTSLSNPRSRSRRRFAALAAACVALLPALPAAAAKPPAVPPELEPPSDAKLIRVDHALGTQNYVCRIVLPPPDAPPGTPPTFTWAFFGPQATLFSPSQRQTATHYLAANPDESGTQRPVWQDSVDSSAVWGMPVAVYPHPDFVEPGAVPWLLLRAVGAQQGPNGGRRLARTAYIQRVHTSGGQAPATGCSEAAHIGAKALVPYSTDYYFYRSTSRE
jgi:hypothetical protein